MNHPAPTPESLRKIFRASWDAAWVLAKDANAKLTEAKERALECGWTALRAKQILPHGDFLKWLDCCGPDVKRQVVHRWMCLAEHYAPKLLGSNVTGRLHLPPLDDKRLTLFLQLTDGKTQHQLELELGIRSPNSVNKVKRLTGKTLSPEEQLQADLLTRITGIRSGFAFCFEHGKDLEREDRARLAWTAFDALKHLLPDGEFQWVGAIRKTPKPLDALVKEQFGGRP